MTVVQKSEPRSDIALQQQPEPKQTSLKVEARQIVADEDMLFGGGNKSQRQQENLFKRKYPPTPFNQEALTENNATGTANVSKSQEHFEEAKNLGKSFERASVRETVVDVATERVDESREWSVHSAEKSLEH